MHRFKAWDGHLNRLPSIDIMQHIIRGKLPLVELFLGQLRAFMAGARPGQEPPEFVHVSASSERPEPIAAEIKDADFAAYKLAKPGGKLVWKAYSAPRENSNHEPILLERLKQLATSFFIIRKASCG